MSEESSLGIKRLLSYVTKKIKIKNNWENQQNEKVKRVLIVRQLTKDTVVSFQEETRLLLRKL